MINTYKIVNNKEHNLVDSNTGEIFENGEKKPMDINFSKVSMSCFTYILNCLGDKQIKTFALLIHNIHRKTNYIFLSQFDIQKHLKFDDETVRKAFNKLISADFMIKIDKNQFMVNPDVVFYGKILQRIEARSIYQKIKKGENPHKYLLDNRPTLKKQTDKMVKIRKKDNADLDFCKVWFSNMCFILEAFENKKVNVFSKLLLEFMDNDEYLILTQSEIRNKVKCSKDSVTKVFNFLDENDIIFMKSAGVYLMNNNYFSRSQPYNRVKKVQKYEKVKYENKLHPKSVLK